MAEHDFFNAQDTVEVGGPGGIRIHTQAHPLGVTPPARDGGQVLPLAARHPRAIAVMLSVVGTGLLAGPLGLVLALGLPMWMLVGPVVLAAVMFVAAVAVSRGALLELDHARRRPELERRLLELAAHSRGRLTVPVVAHHLSVSLPEAEELLTSLARAGYVDIDNDPRSGAVLYLFPSLDTRS